MRSIRGPRTFCVPQRLDLAIKYRLFRHLLHGDMPDAVPLYRWHIEQRTGGNEPGSWKTCIDHYLIEAGVLLASMLDKGFDPECPVTVGNNGALMGGAHRIACALLLGKNVHVETKNRPGRASPWDFDWFLERGLPVDECERLKTWIDRVHGEDGNRARPCAHGASGGVGLRLRGGAEAARV